MGQATDLCAFKSVVRAIGDASRISTTGHKIIVNKSTVPIGTVRMTIDLLER